MRREPTRETCLACGALCCQGRHFILLTEAEAKRLGRGRDIFLRPIANRPGHPHMLAFPDQPGSACPYLDGASASCEIYAERPLACRGYPYGPDPDCPVWPE